MVGHPLLFACGLWLFSSTAASPLFAQGHLGRSAAVVVNTGATDDLGEMVSKHLGVTVQGPFVAYDRNGVVRPRTGPQRSRDRILKATLSADGSLAFLQAADEGPSPKLTSNYEPTKFWVVDSLGREMWSTHGVVQFAWSPNGQDIALLRGTLQVERLPITDSCTVRIGAERSEILIGRRCKSVGWLDRDTVLTSDGKIVYATAMSTRRQTPTAYRSTNISPDRTYSLLVNEEGTIGIVENASGADRAEEVLALIGEYHPAMHPFWVRTNSGLPLLCLTGVRSPSRIAKPTEVDWKIFIIDVGAMSVTHQVPGKPIASTQDTRMMLVARKGKLKFVDLVGQ